MTRTLRSSPGRLAASLAASLIALAAACGGGAPAPASPGSPAGPTPPAEPGGELTTAEAVIEASLAAQGGRERIARVQSMRQTGTFSIPQMGMKGPMTTVAAAPRNFVATIELPGIGTIRRGLTGDVAWEVSPMTGARIVTGDERSQFLREATFNAELIWKELYPKAELAGVVEFAGQPAYKVTLTAADGDTQTRYFAKDTLLPLGAEMVAKSQMGNIPGESTLSDWRDVGGIKFPHKDAQKQGPQAFEILIDKIELDPVLDPSAFALPPEIAALQKPSKP
jgi:zinc protease